MRALRSVTAALGVTLTLMLIAAVAAQGTSTTDGARVYQITIHSRYVHAAMPVVIVIPESGDPSHSLLTFLHGKGGDQDAELYPQFFQALAALGSRAPDVVFPYGGPDSYWHNRADGDWGSYVLKEVIPTAIKDLGANPKRLAIGGISMGGFGAYDLARVRPGMFCAVGGHSAAVWPAAGDAAPGAFDDAADFAHNDLIGDAARNPHLFGKTALWLDGGSEDPFHPYDEMLARDLGIPLHVWPGGHDFDYWNAHWGAYLGFYAGALAHCTV